MSQTDNNSLESFVKNVRQMASISQLAAKDLSEVIARAQDSFSEDQKKEVAKAISELDNVDTKVKEALSKLENFKA